MYNEHEKFLITHPDHHTVIGRACDEIIDAPEGTTGFWAGVTRRDDGALWCDAIGATIEAALFALNARIAEGEEE